MLVVDDNVDMALSLAMLLKLHGHEVDVAHDGSAAIALAVPGGFDVVVLDIGLPSVDGYEVARRIRSRDPADAGPRLVGISGYGFDADRRAAMDAGFDHYLVKPVDPRELEDLLDRWSRAKAQAQAVSG